MIVVRVLDVDDFDFERGAVGLASVEFSHVQVRLDTVLVHADGTFGIGAADQRWFVRVLGFQADAVGWELLVGTWLAAKMGRERRVADREIACHLVVRLSPEGSRMLGRAVFVIFDPLRDVRTASHIRRVNDTHVVTGNELF